MSYKNIRIPKRGGGTRLQRVKVLASGKYKFVKNPSKSKPSKKKAKTTTRKTTRKSGGKRMGKKGGNLQQKIFKWLRIGALALPAGVVAAQPMAADQKVNEILRLYTGVNIKHSMASNELKFDWRRLAMGWTPFLAAVLTTYGIPKIAGIIRRI